MKELFERCWLEVNLDCLKENLQTIKNDIDDNVSLIAVIKANAYGLGLEVIAQELDRLGVPIFAVATAEEAVSLRRIQRLKPILVLGITLPKYTKLLLDNKIIQTIVSLESAQEFDAKAAAYKEKVQCNIALDTGMGRIGFRTGTEADCEKTTDEIKRISNMKNIEICGTFTHFSQADVYDQTSRDYTQMQFERYMRIINRLERTQVNLGLKHLCNSAGIINYKHMHLDAVRPGVTMYGISPGVEMRENREYFEIAQLKARIVQIKQLLKGECVSYSSTYKADKDMITAVVPVGYADGYPRSLSNKDCVLIGGKRAAIIGRVCMDQCVVDITDIPNVKLGDEAVIYGKQAGGILSLQEVSEMAQTIPQEMLCNVNNRVPRVYIKGEKMVCIEDKLL